MAELNKMTDEQLEAKMNEITQNELMTKLNAIITLLGMIAVNTIDEKLTPEDIIINDSLRLRIRDVVNRGLEG